MNYKKWRIKNISWKTYVTNKHGKDVKLTWVGVKTNQDVTGTLCGAPGYIFKNPNKYDWSDNHIKILRIFFCKTRFFILHYPESLLQRGFDEWRHIRKSSTEDTSKFVYWTSVYNNNWKQHKFCHLENGHGSSVHVRGYHAARTIITQVESFQTVSEISLLYELKQTRKVYLHLKMRTILLLWKVLCIRDQEHWNIHVLLIFVIILLAEMFYSLLSFSPRGIILSKKQMYFLKATNSLPL